MINVSNEVQQKISNSNALTHAKIVIDDRVFGYDNKDNTQTPADDGSIYKLDIQYDISQNEFALGTACIQTCEVMLYGASDFEFEGKYFKVYIGYELDEKFTANGAEYPKIEWVPMGVFFTTEIVKKGDWTSFVGYDRTYKYTDMVYVPSSSLGSKPSVYDVFMDIFKFTGAPYDAASFENLMSAKVDMSLLYGSDSDGNTTGYTVRDALGFLSGKVGGCIIVDRYDKFKFLDYSFAATYTEAEGGFLFEEPYLITDDDITDAQISGDGIHGMRYIDVMTSNAAVRYDNGNTYYKNGIVLDSPIITTENEAMAVLDHINDLYAWKGGIFYMTPCSFKLLNGDVTLELGDIISYVPKDTYALGEQSYIPIMHMGINYTGKPEIDISAYNQTQTQQENRTGPLSRSFTAFKRAADNKYKYLDEALEIVSSQITGADGGYIVVDKNEDGTWRQMRVLDSIENPQTAIVINKNGIGFSQDGGQTMNSAALTIDGKFVANSLTGAILQAAQGYIGNWIIDSGQISYKGGLFSDYDGAVHHYRIFLQPAYYDSSQENPNAENTWVFSTQHYSENDSDKSYKGTYIVYADGKVQFNKNAFLGNVAIRNGNVSSSVNLINGESGTVTVGDGLQTGDTRLYTNPDGSVRFCYQTVSAYFDFSIKNITIYGSQAKRGLLSCSGAICVCPKGNLYLCPDSDSGNVRVGHQLIVDGLLTASSAIKAESGVSLDGNYINLGKNSSGIFFYSSNYNLYLYGSSFVQVDSQLRLNFKASSGTVPLAVGTSGQITTTSSSKRYKENITEELNDELRPEKLYDLPVKQYNYKPEYSDIELVAGTQIGIIAEDIEKYYPNALIRNNEGEAESWQDRIMIPAMLKLIQNQKKQIDEINERLKVLEELMIKQKDD